LTPETPQHPLRIGLVTLAWPGVRAPDGIATAASHIAQAKVAAPRDVSGACGWFLGWGWD